MGEDVLDLLLENKEELIDDVLTGGSLDYSNYETGQFEILRKIGRAHV